MKPHVQLMINMRPHLLYAGAVTHASTKQRTADPPLMGFPHLHPPQAAAASAMPGHALAQSAFEAFTRQQINSSPPAAAAAGAVHSAKSLLACDASPRGSPQLRELASSLSSEAAAAHLHDLVMGLEGRASGCSTTDRTPALKAVAAAAEALEASLVINSGDKQLAEAAAETLAASLTAGLQAEQLADAAQAAPAVPEPPKDEACADLRAHYKEQLRLVERWKAQARPQTLMRVWDLPCMMHWLISQRLLSQV